MTTALFGATPVEFIASNREWNDAEVPALVTVTAPMELTFADLVAALFDAATSRELPTLTDAEVRALVADEVFNEGVMHLVNLREEIDDIRPGTADARYLAEVRAVITRVFGAPARRVPAQPTGRAARRLVGVTA